MATGEGVKEGEREKEMRNEEWKCVPLKVLSDLLVVVVRIPNLLQGIKWQPHLLHPPTGL